eukprot:CAMPEP_0116880566 /NCGR_PEP_ID=MMETSP0463-20121206/12503_1 /TAXON_ID=181622 /ORGANISM="Strombidinopsis sp, Strain SopsisLIS2011" /LENGTH=137 /DNA_ID=CAMNT_0004531289 /DNA_START=675 /DNA_END=1089 /DNA_ORIENTATION=-
MAYDQYLNHLKCTQYEIYQWVEQAYAVPFDESTKKKSSDHDDSQCRCHHYILIYCSKSRFINLKNKSECNSTTNHTSISDEQKFIEGDCLCFETKSEKIENSDDGDNSSNDNNTEFNKDKGPAPNGWDQGVKANTDI